MISNQRFVLVMISLALLGSLVADTLQAQQPFYYYPAYGSQRGRIRTVDGWIRDKQRIRWGNGLTPQGAMVFTHAIDVAGAYFSNRGYDESGDSSRRGPSDDDVKQAREADAAGAERAEQLLQRSTQMAAELAGDGDSSARGGAEGNSSEAAAARALAEFNQGRVVTSEAKKAYRASLSAAIASGEKAIPAVTADKQRRLKEAEQLAGVEQLLQAEIEKLNAALQAVPE